MAGTHQPSHPPIAGPPAGPQDRGILSGSGGQQERGLFSRLRPSPSQPAVQQQAQGSPYPPVSAGRPQPQQPQQPQQQHRPSYPPPHPQPHPAHQPPPGTSGATVAFQRTSSGPYPPAGPSGPGQGQQGPYGPPLPSPGNANAPPQPSGSLYRPPVVPASFQPPTPWSGVPTAPTSPPLGHAQQQGMGQWSAGPPGAGAHAQQQQQGLKPGTIAEDEFEEVLRRSAAEEAQRLAAQRQAEEREYELTLALSTSSAASDALLLQRRQQETEAESRALREAMAASELEKLRAEQEEAAGLLEAMRASAAQREREERERREEEDRVLREVAERSEMERRAAEEEEARVLREAVERSKADKGKGKARAEPGGPEEEEERREREEYEAVMKRSLMETRRRWGDENDYPSAMAGMGGGQHQGGTAQGGVPPSPISPPPLASHAHTHSLELDSRSTLSEDDDARFGLTQSASSSSAPAPPEYVPPEAGDAVGEEIARMGTREKQAFLMQQGAQVAQQRAAAAREEQQRAAAIAQEREREREHPQPQRGSSIPQLLPGQAFPSPFPSPSPPLSPGASHLAHRPSRRPPPPPGTSQASLPPPPRPPPSSVGAASVGNETGAPPPRPPPPRAPPATPPAPQQQQYQHRQAQQQPIAEIAYRPRTQLSGPRDGLSYSHSLSGPSLAAEAEEETPQPREEQEGEWEQQGYIPYDDEQEVVRTEEPDEMGGGAMEAPPLHLGGGGQVQNPFTDQYEERTQQQYEPPHQEQQEHQEAPLPRVERLNLNVGDYYHHAPQQQRPQTEYHPAASQQQQQQRQPQMQQHPSFRHTVYEHGSRQPQRRDTEPIVVPSFEPSAPSPVSRSPSQSPLRAAAAAAVGQAHNHQQQQQHSHSHRPPPPLLARQSSGTAGGKDLWERVHDRLNLAEQSGPASIASISPQHSGAGPPLPSPAVLRRDSADSVDILAAPHLVEHETETGFTTLGRSSLADRDAGATEGGMSPSSSANAIADDETIAGIRFGFTRAGNSVDTRVEKEPLGQEGLFPDVVTMSRFRPEGAQNIKFGAFAIEATTWRQLLVYLMHHGNSYVQASARDLEGEKVGKGLEVAICVQFYLARLPYPSYNNPSGVSTRVRVRLDILPPLHTYDPVAFAERVPHNSLEPHSFSAVVFLPKPCARLPIPLSTIATILFGAHVASRQARGSTPSPSARALRDLAGAVDTVMHLNNEEVPQDALAVESTERGVLSRLKGKLKKKKRPVGVEAVELGRANGRILDGATGQGRQNYRPSAPPGRENIPLPESASFITPFVLDGD